MRRLVLLLLLLAIGLFAVEVWVYLLVAQDLAQRLFHETEYLVPLLLIVACSVIGVRLIGRTVQQIPMALIGGSGGRLLVRLLAGMLLAFPGLATSALALLLLIPGVDRLFGKLGDKVFAAILRQQLGRMMGSAPGSSPLAGMFGGMAPRSGPRPSGPRTYDTTAEKP